MNNVSSQFSPTKNPEKTLFFSLLFAINVNESYVLRSVWVYARQTWTSTYGLYDLNA